MNAEPLEQKIMPAVWLVALTAAWTLPWLPKLVVGAALILSMTFFVWILFRAVREIPVSPSIKRRRSIIDNVCLTLSGASMIYFLFTYFSGYDFEHTATPSNTLAVVSFFAMGTIRGPLRPA